MSSTIGWGRKLTADRRNIGLSSPLQNCPVAEEGGKVLVDMTEEELEAYFRQLLVLVMYEGTEQ